MKAEKAKALELKLTSHLIACLHVHETHKIRLECPGTCNPPLRTGLLLLLLEERKKSNTRNLHNLETHTRNITLCVTATTESSNENLVVLVDEVKTTIVGHESGDLLTVLDQLHTHALTHGGVGLLRLNTAAEAQASQTSSVFDINFSPPVAKFRFYTS